MNGEWAYCLFDRKGSTLVTPKAHWFSPCAPYSACGKYRAEQEVETEKSDAIAPGHRCMRCENEEAHG